MRIVSSDPSHLPLFEAMWHQAAIFMHDMRVPAWTAFPAALITSDMAEGRHFLGVDAGGACVGYFSVTWRDEPIWQARDRDDAIYIHRMCGNTALRGTRFAEHVFGWAMQFASARGRAFVRMDTWADNDRLIAYYERCGFVRIGTRTIGDEPRLPPHYQGISLALFENPVVPAPPGRESS